MLTEIKIKQVLTNAGNIFLETIKDEAEAQGHRATGKMIDTAHVEVGKDGDDWQIHGMFVSYTPFVEYGVSSANVPYTQGSGAQSSRYIDALTGWVMLKHQGMNYKTAKGIAFAIAKTAKREGHPTRGSFAYSSNGRRRGFIEQGLFDEPTRKKFTNYLQTALGDAIIA